MGVLFLIFFIVCDIAFLSLRLTAMISAGPTADEVSNNRLAGEQSDEADTSPTEAIVQEAEHSEQTEQDASSGSSSWGEWADFSVSLGSGYKRGPSDYFLERYQGCRMLSISLETFHVEEKARALRDKLDVSSLRIEESKYSWGSYSWTIDGIGRRDYGKGVRRELVELLGLGYSVRFRLEVVENEPIRFAGTGKTYSVVALSDLKRPDTLGGTEVRPVELFPGSKAEAAHEKVVGLCNEGTLLPQQALAAELVLLGATRAEIAEHAGWSPERTEENVTGAYQSLGVRSKDAFAKKLGLSIGTRSRRKGGGAASSRKSAPRGARRAPKKESSTPSAKSTSFSFELAGTAHHRRGADLLANGRTDLLSARREPRNQYDCNAIAIYCNGSKAGYVPKGVARRLAQLMDDGYDVVFTGISTSEYYKTKRKRINLGGGEYYYDYEEDWDHPIPTATVWIVCTAPTPKLEVEEQEDGELGNVTDKGAGALPDDGILRIAVGDFIVRSHAYSCSHKGHEMVPVEAFVTVIVANSYLEERKLRAFYCKQCRMYFVTETAFEKVSRGARLCCRVVEMDDVVNPKKGKGRFSDYAAESLVHQYGYNVNASEGLTSSSRHAILSFIIENGIMGQYDLIAFLEGLIRTREGMRNMGEAISKWKEDVSFLESYKPPEQSLKVGTLYARKSVLGR